MPDLPATSVVPLTQLRGYFRSERTMHRWAARERRRGLAFKRGKFWFVRLGSKLPDGRSVGSAIDPATVARDPHKPVRRPPPLCENWTDEERRRYAASNALVDRFEALLREHGTQRRALHALRQRDGEWARQHGFKLSLRTVRRIRDRVGRGPRGATYPAFDGNPDRRGRPARDRRADLADAANEARRMLVRSYERAALFARFVAAVEIDLVETPKLLMPAAVERARPTFEAEARRLGVTLTDDTFVAYRTAMKALMGKDKAQAVRGPRWAVAYRPFWSLFVRRLSEVGTIREAWELAVRDAKHRGVPSAALGTCYRRLRLLRERESVA